MINHRSLSEKKINHRWVDPAISQTLRARWIKESDFNDLVEETWQQAYASAWRKKNYIKKLNDGDGNSVEGTTPLSQHIHNYFSNLFSLEVQQVDPEIMQEVQTKVTNQMNDFLIHHIRMMMFARPCLVLVI
ncbi:hypothetical protein VPH35_015800 [Triticum aestivum]|uniref:Uncharacterized protein n=1 Tax=Aegilops tauschii subsp. strangulata TaxID=200361 RepID=A0A452ZBY3_AEGTS